jgi:hypothetical protein
LYFVRIGRAPPALHCLFVWPPWIHLIKISFGCCYWSSTSANSSLRLPISLLANGQSGMIFFFSAARQLNNLLQEPAAHVLTAQLVLHLGVLDYNQAFAGFDKNHFGEWFQLRIADIKTFCASFNRKHFYAPPGIFSAAFI